MMINAPHDKPDKAVGIDVTYRLENGVEVYRSYQVPAEDILAEALADFLSDVRAIFHTNDWEELVKNVEGIQIYLDGDIKYEYEILDPAQQQAALEAIRLDAEAGTMAQPNNLHSNEFTVASIHVNWWQQMNHGEGTRWETARVFSDCENTLAFLETLK
jgi:hypothetical protein